MFDFQRNSLYNDHAEFQFLSVSAVDETHNINSLKGAAFVRLCFTSETIPLFSKTWSPVFTGYYDPGNHRSHISLLCKKLKYVLYGVKLSQRMNATKPSWSISLICLGLI
jgi:hypothetical protein